MTLSTYRRYTNNCIYLHFRPKFALGPHHVWYPYGRQDIQSATAENREGKKKEEERRKKKPREKYNGLHYCRP